MEQGTNYNGGIAWGYAGREENPGYTVIHDILVIYPL